jgi:translation initiation factor IF-2
MKTITELSGILVRKAAAAVAEAKRTLPRPAAPAVEIAPPPSEPVPEAAAEPAPEAAGEAASAEAAAPQAASPAPAKASGPAARQGPPAEEVESEEAKAALDAAVATATGLSGDRLARLRDAVKVVGGRLEDVRLVRVCSPEEPVSGAKELNGFLYLVDLAPASMRQVGAPPKKERFGRGGGPRGAGGGGGGGKGAPASGGFSMDSLKDDRKGQRSGPGGRGKPSGGPKR